MNQNQNQAPNRLHLNFGANSNIDRNFGAEQGRAYPTTPSTFPQPFSNQGVQQEVWGAQQQNTAYNAAGYFVNPYQNTQYTQHPQTGNLQAPGAAYRSPGGYNDGANGLVQQFSNQNLGANTGRSASPYARQASPGQPRPRTGNSGQQQYGSHLNTSMPAQRSPSVTDDEPPEKNPSKYSSGIQNISKGASTTIRNFFSENVSRARQRNERAMRLEQTMLDPNISESRKQREYLDTCRKEAGFLRLLRFKEDPSNFATIKIIGKGAFGEVKLVQRKTDGKIYALKSLVKSEMYKKDQLAHVRSERDILAESDSPWVVKLHTTFQDSTFLYMLMEFLPGGDLMTMLIKYEIFTEDITRFYMAELTLAIEAVHKLGFIHRDIKPDNILLDRGGHIKLTDFGLSTGFHKEHEASYYQKLLASGTQRANRANRNSVNIDQISLTVSNRKSINTWRQSRRQLAYSTVGTPDYIAPEIFSGKGYDYGCDWWSVGTIMFECLIGWPPFCAEEPHDTYRKIVDWKRNLHFPPEQPLSSESEDFVRSLINDADVRIGRLGGAHEIKTHTFFRGVQWDSLRKIRAPFEPKLASNIDTQYFPIEEIDQTDHSAMLKEQQRQQGDDNNAELNLPFIGYTYKRFDAFTGS